MTAEFEVERSSRVSPAAAFDGVNDTFGPFGFQIFDTADVIAEIRDIGTALWLLDPAATFTKGSAELDTFTVQFAEIYPATKEYRVRGKRIHERKIALKYGNILSLQALSRVHAELAHVVQELRRDVDRAVTSHDDQSPPAVIGPATPGQVLVFDQNGDLAGGLDADLIAAVPGYVVSAQTHEQNTAAFAASGATSATAANAALTAAETARTATEATRDTVQADRMTVEDAKASVDAAETRVDSSEANAAASASAAAGSASSTAADAAAATSAAANAATSAANTAVDAAAAQTARTGAEAAQTAAEAARDQASAIVGGNYASVDGNATWADGTTVSAYNATVRGTFQVSQNIVADDDTGNMRLFGGKSIDQGGNLILWADEHTEYASDIWFRSGNVVRLQWDHSAGTWISASDFQFDGNVQVAQEIHGNADTGTTRISAGASPESGANIILYGPSHADAYDIRLRTDTFTRLHWDNSANRWYSYNNFEITGNLDTTGYIQAGNGGGSVALTVNDGGGNANVTFNHKSLIPDNDGSAARITSDVDSTVGRLSFQVWNNITSGVQPVGDGGEILSLYTGRAQFAVPVRVKDNIYNEDNTNLLRISGGSASAVGAYVDLFSGNHPTGGLRNVFASRAARHFFTSHNQASIWAVIDDDEARFNVPIYDRNGNEVLASFVLPDQTITTSQTVAVPSGVTSVYAKVSGSGGGGGRYYNGICIGGTAGATSLSVNGTTYTANGGGGGGRSGGSVYNGPPGTASGGAINTTGGGAAGGSGIDSGGSGGAGGYCEGLIVSLTEGDQITITIGAAGTGCLGGQTGTTGSVVLSFRGG